MIKRCYLFLILLSAPCFNAEAQITTTSVAQESLSTTSGAPSGASGSPVVSTNGKFLAFRSSAADIVANDLNQNDDIFLKNLTDGSVSRVSVSSKGVEGDSVSLHPAISPVTPEGFYAVAFASFSTNLGGITDLLTGSDIFVHIPTLSFTEVLSFNTSTLALGDADSDNPSITVLNSPKRILIAFSSFSTNLVSGDGNGEQDVFLATVTVPADINSFDRSNNISLIRISKAADGGEANDGSDAPKISGDGKFIVFTSRATNLVENLTTSGQQIFRYAVDTGKIELVSKSTAGVPANSDCSEPVLSFSGRFVAYLSDSTNIISDGASGRDALILHDLTKGTIKRINASANGEASTGRALSPAISANGRFLAFSDTGPNLVTGDANDFPDIFVKDSDSNAVARLSTAVSGEANGRSDSTSIGGTSFNSLSSSAFFRSLATNLTSGATASGAGDIYSTSATMPAPQLVSGTIIETPADVTTRGKRGVFTLQKFSFAAPAAFLADESRSSRAATKVTYEVRVAGTGNRKKVRETILAKRNTVTTGKLKPGTYNVRYRALATKNDKTTAKTSFSPRQTFQIS